MVQAYIRRVHEQGGPVSSQIVIGAAQGIMSPLNKIKLKEYGGHTGLNRHCMGTFVALSYEFCTKEAHYSKRFLNDLVTIVQIKEGPPELVLNWDQTGIKLVPTTSQEQGGWN